MHLKTILNRVAPHKSFVYGKVRWDEAAAGPTLEVAIQPRAGSRPICSGCGQRGPGYDRLPARRFEFVPLWQIAVVFVYAMRRVACPRCGVTVEQVPWGDGKHSLTNQYRWFLATWARRLSWSEVGSIFSTSWDSVCRSVEHAVEWGLKRRDLSGVTAIGIDEIAWHKGHQYLTLVYDISGDVKRLLAVAEDRTEASLRKCCWELGASVRAQVRFVCSDMWRPYLTVIGECLSEAVHVLDRFHIMQKFGKALDEIRAEETRQLKQAGYEPVLTKSRWCLLKRPENLSEQQTVKLKELLKYNLRSVRAYLLREDFQRFWEYRGPTWAGKFLDEWTTRAMRSRLEPLKKLARTLRGHRELILNWFRAKGEISAGAVEGLNNKVKLVTRKSYGFRTAKVAKLALLHNLGRLPEPEFTHKFC
jgi:transposase